MLRTRRTESGALLKWPLVWRADYEAACRSITQLEANVRDSRAERDEERKNVAFGRQACAERDTEIASLRRTIERSDDARNLANAERDAAIQLSEATDRQRVQAEVRCNIAEQREREWATRYETLLTKTHQLQLMGAVPVVPNAPHVPREQDMLVQAINDACRGKPGKVRSDMMRAMREDRANEVPDMEILAKIQGGVSSIDEIDGLPT